MTTEDDVEFLIKQEKNKNKINIKKIIKISKNLSMYYTINNEFCLTSSDCIKLRRYGDL